MTLLTHFRAIEYSRISEDQVIDPTARITGVSDTPPLVPEQRQSRQVFLDWICATCRQRQSVGDLAAIIRYGIYDYFACTQTCADTLARGIHLVDPSTFPLCSRVIVPRSNSTMYDTLPRPAPQPWSVVGDDPDHCQECHAAFVGQTNGIMVNVAGNVYCVCDLSCGEALGRRLIPAEPAVEAPRDPAIPLETETRPLTTLPTPEPRNRMTIPLLPNDEPSWVLGLTEEQITEWVALSVEHPVQKVIYILGIPFILTFIEAAYFPPDGNSNYLRGVSAQEVRMLDELITYERMPRSTMEPRRINVHGREFVVTLLPTYQQFAG